MTAATFNSQSRNREMRQQQQNQLGSAASSSKVNATFQILRSEQHGSRKLPEISSLEAELRPRLLADFCCLQQLVSFPDATLSKSNQISARERPDVLMRSEAAVDRAPPPRLQRRAPVHTSLVCKHKHGFICFCQPGKHVILTYLSLTSHCNPPSIPEPRAHTPNPLPPPFAMTSRKL